MQTQHPLAVVTPTLDGDVLVVLARADAPFTAGTVQRVLGGRSYTGVRKVLDRLAVQGIVTSQRIGGVLSYRLNRDHLAAEHVLALADLRTALVHRIRDHVESWRHPPVWAALFGSAARGEMRPESDVDLVLVDPGADVDEWEVGVGALAGVVTRWTGNDARVLSMTEAEVQSGARTRDPVLTQVLADAVTISGDPEWLRRALSRYGR